MGWVSRNRTIRISSTSWPSSDDVEPARRQQAVEDSAEGLEVHGIMAEEGDDPFIHVDPMDLPDVFGSGKASAQLFPGHFLRDA